jgi:hypothetical protein
MGIDWMSYEVTRWQHNAIPILFLRARRWTRTNAPTDLDELTCKVIGRSPRGRRIEVPPMLLALADEVIE